MKIQNQLRLLFVIGGLFAAISLTGCQSDADKATVEAAPPPAADAKPAAPAANKPAPMGGAATSTTTGSTSAAAPVK